MIIYKITNKLNGKSYIGQTVRDFDTRLAEHKRKQNSIVGKAINKYGDDNFHYEIIARALTIDELNNLEYELIKAYNTLAPNGYNQVEGGGSTTGYTYKEESKKKMSLAKKGRFSGENNSFYGKTHSEETKQRLSQARKGRKLSEEWKTKIAESQYKKVCIVDLNLTFDSVKDCAKYLNVQSTNVTRACKSDTRKVRGYQVKYV